MPKVSVLMPCYNAAGTLDEALESLTCQTLADFEIVAVEDGSTDGTPAILQAWAVREPRLRVIALPHSGIVNALNAGLEACRAAYLARMDADDRSHPHRLALQAGYLDAHPEVGVVGCLVRGFPEGQVGEGYRVYIEWLNSLQTQDDIRREMFVESPLAHPSAMMRRESLLEAGGYQERGWAEDYDLWLRFYLRGVRFAKLPEVLLDWREHPDRLTRSDGRYSLENFLRLKAYYLRRGPLEGRDAVIIWGAGMMGRRLNKHLARQGANLAAFIDIDPRKIGRTLRGLPILAPQELPDWLGRFAKPAVLAAVGARGARGLIRQRLNSLGLQEGEDWWSVA
jgi:glycosyltransferase involved in cell wall biosynthesis